MSVCSANRLRSPTAEHVFASWPAIKVDSAGKNHDACNPLTAEQVEWSDVIVVMAKTHKNKVQQHYRKWLNGKRVVCLDIPDEYEFMDEQLVRLLQAKMRRFLPMTLKAHFVDSKKPGD